MSPAEFVSSHARFLGQYSWVLLQLERTSVALDSAHRLLRARVSAARRRAEAEALAAYASLQPGASAAAAVGGGGAYGQGAHQNALSGVVSEARKLVRTGVRELVSEGLLIPSAALARSDAPVHALMVHAVALLLSLKRVMVVREEGGAGGGGGGGHEMPHQLQQWLNLAAPALLQAMRPKYDAAAAASADEDDDATSSTAAAAHASIVHSVREMQQLLIERELPASEVKS
jgi:hypothetical protein